ncbi:MAG: DUF5693 family protein [Candidatus Velthaea sp.]
MTYRRILYLLLAVGLLASAYVAARRVHHEAQARNVEIAMDDADFAALARSYGYDQRVFLRALHDAGLTSLAVAEELGGGVAASSGGAVYAGSSLLDQSRLVALTDPLLARLARTGGLRSDEMYVLAFDALTAARYREQLALKFSPRAVRVLRATLPAVFAVRTQSDFFQSVGLGVPADRMDLAKRLGLVLVPRLQNDERFRAPQIDRLVHDAIDGRRVRTLVFFGLRNQVLGYPANIEATAELFRTTKLSFGSIETYDSRQLQAGNDELARKLPGHVVRVQAISKVEQDKLRPQDIVARYVLGVRERNIRVVYLRPFAHQWDTGKGPLSIEATNVEIVKRIADGVKRDGYRLGGASPIYPFVVQPWLVALVSLAVAAVVLLVLEALGIGNSRWLIAAVVLDLALLAAGYAAHRDMTVRKALALAAGIAFPVAGIVAVAPLFRRPAPVAFGAAVRDGARVLAVATLVTLAGALVIVGLLSTPLSMVEVDRFAGVKLVLLLPPLLALMLYALTPLWGAKIDDPAAAAAAPVRFYQLALGVAIVAGAYVLQARSGNQSDIAPSSLELALRSHLTSILTVRPRFKEFLIGFPALMLLPSLVPVDRRIFGWLFVLAAGMGLGDVIDTFSHLHTPLAVSALRLVNGAVLGAVAGCAAVAIYRRWR